MPSVLVVDDEEHILYGLRKALSRRGWEVLEASSVEEARDIIRTRPVEIVLTDIRMTGESGLVFLQEVKAIRPETHVVVMTARGSEDMEREVLSLGAEAYLEKPFDLTYLDKVLRNIIARKGFKGVVQELTLIDILQLLAYESGTAKIEVSSPDGKGAIYVENGRLVHAVFEALEGQEAFDRILSLEGGSFSMRRGEKPMKRTLDEPLDAILLRVVTSKEEEGEVKDEGVISLENLSDFSFTASLGLTEEVSVPEEVRERLREVAERLKGVKGAISGGAYSAEHNHLEAFGESHPDADTLGRVVKVLKALSREEMFVDGETNYYFRLKGDVLIWIESEGTPLVVLRIETGKLF